MRRFSLVLTIFVLTSGLPAARAWQESATAVEPADLARREDLVGKLVNVDDRVRFFQNHPRVGFDELYLRRTPVVFRLPPPLRPDSQPGNPAVVVQGRLVREGTQLFVDVTSLSLQPADLERLDKSVASLSARDYTSRLKLAEWAARRARDFADNALAARAKEIEAEGYRIESNAKRLVDPPQEWLSLAKEGRKKGVAEPDPSALAHRAFRAMLAAAKSPPDLDSLKEEVERFFPSSATPPAGGETGLGAWGEQYEQDPATAYRSAPAGVRSALDRRLWADIVQKVLESRVAMDLQGALKAVDDAEKLVPERPLLAAKLVDQAQTRARETLASLSLAEARSVASLLQKQAKDQGPALEFYRDWLKVRRDRLSPTDAEGPVALASLYESLLNDADSARRLLDRAWKIAPGSGPVTEAYKLRGYRRVGDGWEKDSPAVAEVAAAPTGTPDASLQGKTPAEVKAIVGGEPTNQVVVATKGRITLQWIFQETRQTRYVNFERRPGSQTPRVVSDFFLAR
ncbi:hypothetical protein [Paludisphaera rhizosphaerae]|uniref:hypothetical protein n=1 Tax=Paludisphaera rhizosphaerae TaxID=2711216 RepID=UPI0013EC75E9|nr:hypothetical protein [Paludisphaera rhizosphaerae]